MIFLRVCFKIIGVAGMEGRQKFSLLQSYEVLWIHVIDAICTYKRWFIKNGTVQNTDWSVDGQYKSLS